MDTSSRTVPAADPAPGVARDWHERALDAYRSECMFGTLEKLQTVPTHHYSAAYSAALGGIHGHTTRGRFTEYGLAATEGELLALAVWQDRCGGAVQLAGEAQS